MPTPDETHPDLPNPEAAYGGADAVEKTSYVVGQGTDPEASAGGEVIAQTPPGGGANPIAWVAIAIVLVIAVIYGVGVFW